jgi:hypothetical protein
VGCRRGGSPLYAALLERAARDVEAGGPAWEALRGRERDPLGSAVALRFMAAAHRLALEGRAPALAAVLPTAGGEAAPASRVWPALRDALREHLPEVRRLAARACQTNEPGRSAALLPGFLLLARRFGLPFRLLELGASAGLNLRWDRYRYEGAGAAWGDPASPVVLEGVFGAPPPPLDPPSVVVGSRRGCDPHPLDPADPEDRATLRSSVWADQAERLRTVDAALALAAGVPATVDRAGAGAWLTPERLGPRPGELTVVFHSVVLQYLGEEERRTVLARLEDAGAAATAGAPLAWLRMEPPDWRRRHAHEVWLRSWPGGEDRRLATSGPHGRLVRWVAAP